MKVDPRGQRFSAALSAAVLAAVIVTGSGWLLAAQAVVFGIGAVLGLSYAPYGLIYRWLVRPRLGPPREMEDAAGPRFSQGVGLVVSIIGVIGYAAGLPPSAWPPPRWHSRPPSSTRPSACAWAARCMCLFAGSGRASMRQRRQNLTRR